MWDRGGSTKKKTTTEMKLTVGNFEYLGIILEGFFFGGIYCFYNIHGVSF